MIGFSNCRKRYARRHNFRDPLMAQDNVRHISDNNSSKMKGDKIVSEEKSRVSFIADGFDYEILWFCMSSGVISPV